MRMLFLPGVLLVVGGCQRQVPVPTTKELLDNRHLLAEWQIKCDTGEYSNLAATAKAEMCSTTQVASQSVLQIENGKREADFFSANTRRK